jgi:Golgi phosphoprotein 3
VLGLVEEIVLLQLDPTSGRFIVLPLSVVDTVTAGAALMDLAIRNRIDTDLDQLSVIDRAPVGDDILDDVLMHLTQGQDDLTIRTAIERVTPYASRYRQQALKRLAERGILRERDGLFLRVFQARRYPIVDDRQYREVRERLRQLLLTDEIPDPQDVVLISLLQACGLLDLVLAPHERAGAVARVEQLARLDLIGQAIKRAVGEIRFAVQNATKPA